jgi:hypothetical protein
VIGNWKYSAVSCSNYELLITDYRSRFVNERIQDDPAVGRVFEIALRVPGHQVNDGAFAGGFYPTSV